MNDDDVKKLLANDEDGEGVEPEDFELDQSSPAIDNLEDVVISEESETEQESEAKKNAEMMEETDDTSASTNSDDISSNWIEVIDGMFVCSECENKSRPETNTVDGTVEADTEVIRQELIERPTKIVYGSCPVCGMEYLFKVVNEKLYMEPSDMLK